MPVVIPIRGESLRLRKSGKRRNYRIVSADDFLFDWRANADSQIGGVRINKVFPSESASAPMSSRESSGRREVILQNQGRLAVLQKSNPRPLVFAGGFVVGAGGLNFLAVAGFGNANIPPGIAGSPFISMNF